MKFTFEEIFKLDSLAFNADEQTNLKMDQWSRALFEMEVYRIGFCQYPCCY